jgi:hypothetical protein
MVGILRQSRSIPAHIRPAQMENAHAEPFNAFYLPLDICNRRHFLCSDYSGTLVRRGRPMKSYLTSIGLGAPACRVVLVLGFSVQSSHGLYQIKTPTAAAGTGRKGRMLEWLKWTNELI